MPTSASWMSVLSSILNTTLSLQRSLQESITRAGVHTDDAKSGLEASCAAVPCLSSGRHALFLTNEKARRVAVTYTGQPQSRDESMTLTSWRFLQQSHWLGQNSDHFPQCEVRWLIDGQQAVTACRWSRMPGVHSPLEPPRNLGLSVMPPRQTYVTWMPVVPETVKHHVYQTTRHPQPVLAYCALSSANTKTHITGK